MFELFDFLAYYALFSLNSECVQFSIVISTDSAASLLQVLDFAGLLDHYFKFLTYQQEAAEAFRQGYNRDAFNVFYKIWYDPYIIPALLLKECYHKRQLVLPDWGKNNSNISVKLPKKSGGYREIIVPPLQNRICMGAVNTILQSSCSAWSDQTTGFKPNNGTHTAISLLQEQASYWLKHKGMVYIITFDVRNAYDSVTIPHLFSTLELNNMPLPMRKLLWNWHNSTRLHLNGNPEQRSGSTKLALGAPLNAEHRGLYQGFSYSPTLFAWYLDTILIKNSDFVCYADNMAAALPTEEHVFSILDSSHKKLASVGLQINPQSIQVFRATPDESFELKWLGHTLSLPSCSIKLYKHTAYEKSIPQNPATSKTFTNVDWKTLLQTNDWLNTVRQGV